MGITDEKIDLIRYVRPKSLVESMPVSDRVSSALLRKDEQTKLACNITVHTAILDLRKVADKAEYESLLNRIANKKAELKFLSRQWTDDHTGVIVYLEWVDYLIDKA